MGYSDPAGTLIPELRKDPKQRYGACRALTSLYSFNGPLYKGYGPAE